MVVNIPNPDDLHDAARDIFAEMLEMGVRKNQIVLTKSRGAESIHLNDYYRNVAETAKDNGHVTVHGTGDDGVKVERSTKEHPEIIVVDQPDDRSAFTAVLSAARAREEDGDEDE